jgi:hypothetical protein
MKEQIFIWLTNPTVDKKIASKLMDILTLIQESEEMIANNRNKRTDEQLEETALRLQKKFQSGLKMK